MEEREAVERLKRGDIGGLEMLVVSHQLRVLRTAYLITQDNALAEDIVQAAFLRAYERIGQFDARRSFGPWFMRSVVNDALKAARRSARQTSLDSDFSRQLADPSPGPPERAERAHLRAEVQQALDQLPVPQRAVIVLRYYLSYSVSEMAQALDIPPGTVKWRLHQARQRLRTLLGDLQEAEVIDR